MAFSQNTIIQRVRDLLQDNPWQAQASVADTTGTITLVAPADNTRWDEGAILEWQDTGEQCWVQTASTGTTTTLVALRGINGTTAASHAQTTVYRDPVFKYSWIKDAIELTILSMWPYAWKKVTMNITFDSTATWYDTSASLMEVIQVSQPQTAPARAYVYGSGSSPVVRNLPASIVASGIGIAFPNGWVRTDTQIQLDFAAKLTTTTAGTPTAYSDISDGLLAETIAIGAAARLVMMSETPRVTQEDIGMGDSSVQPGARARAGQLLWAMFLDKRRQYQQELMRTIPLRNPYEANPLLVGRTNVDGYYSSPPWG